MRFTSRRGALLVPMVVSLVLFLPPASAEFPVIDPVAAPGRSSEPVILSGSQFPEWSAGPEVAVREPQVANDPAGFQSDCEKEYTGEGHGYDGEDHNCYHEGRVHIKGVKSGVPVGRLLAYKW